MTLTDHLLTGAEQAISAEVSTAEHAGVRLERMFLEVKFVLAAYQ